MAFRRGKTFNFRPAIYSTGLVYTKTIIHLSVGEKRLFRPFISVAFFHGKTFNFRPAIQLVW